MACRTVDPGGLLSASPPEQAQPCQYKQRPYMVSVYRARHDHYGRAYGRAP